MQSLWSKPNLGILIVLSEQFVFRSAGLADTAMARKSHTDYAVLSSFRCVVFRNVAAQIDLATGELVSPEWLATVTATMQWRRKSF